MPRFSSLALLVIAAMLPVTGATQRRDKEEAYAFLLFLQSIAAQRTARTCERGVPGYRQKFDDLYARWSTKYRDQIARGESVFRDARARTEPYTDPAKLEQIERAIAELAQSPRETGPIVLDDHWKATCEAILEELQT